MGWQCAARMLLAGALSRPSGMCRCPLPSTLPRFLRQSPSAMVAPGPLVTPGPASCISPQRPCTPLTCPCGGPPLRSSPRTGRSRPPTRCCCRAPAAGGWAWAATCQVRWRGCARRHTVVRGAGRRQRPLTTCYTPSCAMLWQMGFNILPWCRYASPPVGAGHGGTPRRPRRPRRPWTRRRWAPPRGLSPPCAPARSQA